jgi:hypothetical protein
MTTTFSGPVVSTNGFVGDVTGNITGIASVTAIAGTDASLGIAGLAAAQGGAVALVGGTSSTAGNAGGAVTATGGTPGATSAGGAVTLAAGAGGATSGDGGVASLTGGAGTAGNGAGGVSKVVGGAGQGTGAGGAAQVTGGASGDGATGEGGDVSITGGAAASTNGGGGSIVLTPGAKAGSGIAGGNFLRSSTGMHFRQQTAQVNKADGAETVTAAQMINGIVVFTVTEARTLTTPTGAAISAGCPADLAVGDSFDLHVITIGAGADDIATLTAGDGGVTFVGNVTIGPDASTFNGYGTFRFRNTGAGTWVGYRIG